MSLQELGTTGAKRQSWRTGGPREMLQKMMLMYPKDTEDDLLKRFTDEVIEDTQRLAVIIEYWFTNNYRSLSRDVSPAARAKVKEAIAVETAAVKVAVIKRIKSEAKIMLLKMMTPSGKPLGKCTGAECVKFGGWYVRVGKKVGATKIVDSVLTEKSIRAML